MSKKVLYYINQFFGQIGGEEMAHVAPTFEEKAVGPAMGFERSLGQEAKIVGTMLQDLHLMPEDMVWLVPELQNL